MIAARGRLSSGVRIWGLAAALVVVLGPATTAAAAGQDEVSDVELAVACAPYDNIQAHLSFHVEAGPGTPASGRITDLSGTHAGVAVGDSRAFHLEIPGGAEYYATGDYDLSLSDYAMRSIMEGDTYEVTLSYANGDVAASDTVTVACFDGGTDVTPHDFTVKARVGVPRTFRLLEHTTFGSIDLGFPDRAWVTEDSAIVDALAAPSDLLDLEPATDAALGASLADLRLTVTPTLAGTYDLDWGVVAQESEYTPVEITADPQVVSFPYSQDIVVDAGGWVTIVSPVCTADMNGVWQCTGGEGYWEEVQTVSLVGPTTYTFVGHPVDRTYVKTSETNTAFGPAGMTIEVIDAPIQPDASEIVEGSRGNVDVADTVNPGQTLTVDVGEDMADGYVDVWLNSTPTYLGLFPVGPSGTVNVTVPANFVAGEHRVVVTDEVGNFVGWDNLRVAGANGSGQLAATGLGDAALVSQAAGALALIAWGVVIVRRSRRAP